MTAVHELHKVCVVARKYPTTMFWLLTCAAFAAGVQENSAALAVILVIQLLLMGHTARQMWSPPIRMAVGNRRGGDGRHTRPGD